jgi:hypothetical protein
MASDSSGIYIFAFLVLVGIGIVAYAYLSKRITADKRKQLIKAFKASPKIAKDAPILVQGTAQAPDVILPTTGEHVAYYGLFVLSKETAIADTRKGIDFRINGLPVGTARTTINVLEGFTFFETSGDFTIASGSTYYFVRVSGIIASFAKAASMVSGLVAEEFRREGMREGFFEDTMAFSNAQQALKVMCGFDAPIVTNRSRRHTGGWNKTTTTQRASVSVVTATSRLDSRVHEFMAGYNLPQGVLDLIAKHGITLKDKDEVIVIETFIPLNKEVFVFGTFDGDRSLVFADGTVQLSVSYMDPAGES